MSDTKSGIFFADEFESFASTEKSDTNNNQSEPNQSSLLTDTALTSTPISDMSNQEPKEEIHDTEFSSAKNENELFFEKFNNTKKNHKKAELEKAKKQINKKNKTLSFERRLEENSYVAKVYGAVGGVIALILAISITVFVINFRFYVNTDIESYKSSNTWYGIALGISTKYYMLNKVVVIMSGIAFSLVPIPFFFLLSTWFMGLNQIFRSRNFMVFLFSCIGLSLLIVLITIPMFSVIYSWWYILPFNNLESWKI